MWRVLLFAEQSMNGKLKACFSPYYDERQTLQSHKYVRRLLPGIYFPFRYSSTYISQQPQWYHQLTHNGLERPVPLSGLKLIWFVPESLPKTHGKTKRGSRNWQYGNNIAVTPDESQYSETKNALGLMEYICFLYQNTSDLT